MERMVALWLISAVWLNVAGWTLAALHQLNPASYAIALTPGLATAFLWLRAQRLSIPIGQLRRRFSRTFPFLFLFLSGLAFLGGILHAPNNYDGLTYRLPRMLDWMMAGKWFWIPTINERMNCANTAWEWTAMPFLIFFRSDRAMFLINATGFLLLPGLLFYIMNQLGVARRVAWTWMWILPLMYGLITQAASIANDLTAATFFLISIYFGLKARQSQTITHVWQALLAAALMTGVKVSNAPLCLACLVAMWPALKSLLKKPFLTGGIIAVSLLVSAVPTLYLNQVHTGGWSGDPQNAYHMHVQNPVAAFIGNAVIVSEYAVQPPVLPNAPKISRRIKRELPTPVQDLLQRQFPTYFISKLVELPGEENSGIGLSITLPLLAGLLAAFLGVGWKTQGRAPFIRVPPVVVATGMATLVYMLTVGSECAARLLIPFYPLLVIPFLTVPSQQCLLKRRAWRFFLALMSLSLLPALILSPSRPLWPAGTICQKILAAHPRNPLWTRMLTVYSTYAGRHDSLGSLRAKLPPDTREVGLLAGGNDMDYSLWRPLGERKVVYLAHDLPHFFAHPQEVEWVVLKDSTWPQFCPRPFAEWARENGATPVESISVVQAVSAGPEKWTLLHFSRN